MLAETRAQRVLSAVLVEKRRQKVSDAQLAKRWGVSTAYLIDRFQGRAGLTISELGHIADALGVPVEQLAGEQ